MARALRRPLHAALVLCLLAVPLWLPSPYHLHVLIMAGIFAILALSLNLLLGYAGLLSLGHAAFFGIGAYASALLALRLAWPFAAGFVTAVAVAGGTGYLTGRLAIRLRGAYFVLVTLSFAGVVSLVSVNWMGLTNGPLGLPGVPPAELLGFAFATKRSVYYLVLAVAAGAYLLCARLVRSRIGRALIALRENEPLAASVGVDGTRYLALATALSAALAGTAGSLYAHYTRFVSPEVFLFSYTLTMVVMVLAGGKGTLAGPVVGAVVFTVLPEALRLLVAWQWQMLLYGTFLLLTVFFLPQGVVPMLAAWRERR
jgi:branched-chain amino acid transport system permease protein